MADEQTLRFYADNAVTYVDRARGRPNMQLQAFLAALPPVPKSSNSAPAVAMTRTSCWCRVST
jgi:hypothetical protein